MPEKKTGIQHVEISIRLGKKQAVKILADNRVTFGQKKEHEIQYERTGSTNDFKPGDIKALLSEVCDKLKTAFDKNKSEIDLTVDGTPLVATKTK